MTKLEFWRCFVHQMMTLLLRWPVQAEQVHCWYSGSGNLCHIYQLLYWKIKRSKQNRLYTDSKINYRVNRLRSHSLRIWFVKYLQSNQIFFWLELHNVAEHCSKTYIMIDSFLEVNFWLANSPLLPQVPPETWTAPEILVLIYSFPSKFAFFEEPFPFLEFPKVLVKVGMKIFWNHTFFSGVCFWTIPKFTFPI